MKKLYFMFIAVITLSVVGVMEWPYIQDHWLMAKEVNVTRRTSASRPTEQVLLTANKNKAQDQLMVIVGWVTEILPDEQKEGVLIINVLSCV